MKNINTFLSFWSCFLFVSFILVLSTNSTVAQVCTQDSDCPVSGKCYNETVEGKTYNKCVDCTNDSHCSGTLNRCLPGRTLFYNKCVECTGDNHCSGEKCIENRCIACTDNSHCGEKQICQKETRSQAAACVSVECVTNRHCNFDQLCDPSTHTCKASFQAPEPQLSPEKYKFDKRKNPRQLETSPQTQQQLKQQQLQQPYIDQKNVNPGKALPKDTKQIN